jgi:hypothetical protein
MRAVSAATRAILVAAFFACGAPAKPQPPTAPAPPPEPVETQPKPPPAPQKSQTGIAECDQVLALYEKIFECDAFKGMPPEAQEAQRQGLAAWKSSWHSDTADQREAAATGCRAGIDALHQAAKAMDCTL